MMKGHLYIHELIDKETVREPKEQITKPLAARGGGPDRPERKSRLVAGTTLT